MKLRSWPLPHWWHYIKPGNNHSSNWRQLYKRGDFRIKAYWNKSLRGKSSFLEKLLIKVKQLWYCCWSGERSLTAGEICVESHAGDTFLLQYWGNIKGQGVLTLSSACVWPKMCHHGLESVQHLSSATDLSTNTCQWKNLPARGWWALCVAADGEKSWKVQCKLCGRAKGEQHQGNMEWVVKQGVT